ncbi:MAG: tetratricopeptide repeat protein [Bacteroidales bacterium]|nr:tetratricopeptide repeat protein [Bacteroidales bacterium]
MKAIVNVSKCPSCEKLEQMAFGTLPEGEHQMVLEHINSCSECRDIYEAFKGYDKKTIDDAEQEIGALVDDRLKHLKEGKPQGRIVKMVAKYAAAASIVGLGVWGFNHMDTGKSGADLSEFSVTIPDAAFDSPDALQEQVAINDDVQRKGLDINVGSHREDNTPVIRASEGDNTILTRGNESAATVVPNKQKQQVKVDNEKIQQIVSEANQMIVLGDYLDAKDILEDAINQDPKNSKALRLLGICNLNLKYYSNAIDCFKKVKPASKAEAEQIANYIKECEQKMKN